MAGWVVAAAALAVLAPQTGAVADQALGGPVVPAETRKTRPFLPEGDDAPAQGIVKDEALVALHVSKGLNAIEDLASPQAIRNAAGYSSAPNHSSDNSHVGGFGFVSQGWNTGQNAQAQGVTNMSAQFGTASGSFSAGSPSP